MAASAFKADNLVAIVDRNRLQISGNTEDVMGQDSRKSAGHHSAGMLSPLTATVCRNYAMHGKRREHVRESLP